MTTIALLTPFSEPAPNRGMSEDVYAPAADVFAAELTGFVPEMNGVINQINTVSGELTALGLSLFNYTFDAGTSAADPTAGKLRLNHASPASATALYISETDRFGTNLGGTLATWDDNAQAVKGILRLVDPADPTIYAEYTVSGSRTDSGTWNTFSLTYVAGNGSFTAGEPVVAAYQRTGADGSDAEFASPTRTIATSGSVTSADNGYLLDVTASGVTLTLDSAAALGSSFLCTFLHSNYDVTLTGTFNDGGTSKTVPAGAAAILNSNGTSHRLTLLGRPVLRINETALSGLGNIDSLNVPSWVSEIKIKLRGASSNGTAVYTVHIGTGGVADTSATYTGGISQLPNASATNSVANSTQFQILAAVSAANVMDATVILTRNSDDGTSWNCMVSGQSVSGTTTTGGGAKTLSGRLDMVRLGLNGSVNLWDAGFYSMEFWG